MKQGFKYVIIIWLLTLPVLVCTVRIRTRIIGSNRCDFIKVESLTLGENGSTTLSCLDCNVAGGRGAVSCACTGGSIGVEIPVIGGGISVYNMFMCKSYFQTNVPKEILEASQIDGCGEVRLEEVILTNKRIEI